MRMNLARQATIGLLAPALFTTIAVAQSNVTGTPPPGVIGPRIAPPPPDVDGGCAHGFAGTTTIAGGWTAFEAASGQVMTVLTCACADFAPVTTISTPCSGDLTLSPTHEKRTVGASWGTWSHGYTGEIYWTLGSTTALYTMPGDADAFDCYIEPNPFAPQNFTVTGTASNGDTAVLVLTSISGASGASHFGFWTDLPCNLSTVSVAGTADFAIGEARISCKEAGADKKILVYDNNTIHQMGLTAARNKSGDVTQAFAADFNSLLGSQTWDIVVFDCPSSKPVGGFGPLQAYVDGGGKAVAAYWDWDVDVALAASFDCSLAGTISLTPGVTSYQALPAGIANGTFDGVTMPNTDWHNHWGDDGDMFNPLGTAVGLGHIGTPSQPVTVKGNDGSTIATFAMDDAGDSWIPSCIRLWENMINKVNPGDGGPCTKVCQSNPTSVGPGASIEYKGEVAPGVHRFSAEPVPNDNGIFIHGATLIRVPFGHGFLCAGGDLVRVLPPVAAVGNRAEKDVAIPPGMGIRYWQYWFRDPAAGGPAFNTSNALCCDFGG